MPKSGNVARPSGPTLTSLRRIFCFHPTDNCPLKTCGVGGSKMGRAVNLGSQRLAGHQSEELSFEAIVDVQNVIYRHALIFITRSNEKFSEHLNNRPQFKHFSDMVAPSSAAEPNGHDCHAARLSTLLRTERNATHTSCSWSSRLPSSICTRASATHGGGVAA